MKKHDDMEKSTRHKPERSLTAPILYRVFINNSIHMEEKFYERIINF